MVAEHLGEVFGQESVTKLYAKTWQVKEQGLSECENKLGDSMCNRETFKVSCQIASMALKDRIAQVVLKGCNFLETVLKTHESQSIDI